MNKTKKKGFTLIELLVVIAIIGLLATLSVVALNNARARARDSRRVSDIKQIQTALEMYYNENNEGYPEQETRADIVGISDDLSDYITLPAAPTPVDGDCVAGITDGTTPGNTYSYQSDGTTYTIWYCLGNDTGEIKGSVLQLATPLSSFSVAAE